MCAQSNGTNVLTRYIHLFEIVSNLVVDRRPGTVDLSLQATSAAEVDSIRLADRARPARIERWLRNAARIVVR